MTATARKLQSTPMAPYMDVMRSLDVNDMHLVVEFMNETIREAEEAKDERTRYILGLDRG